MRPSGPWKHADLPAALRLALDAALDKNARGPLVLRVTEIVGYTDWVLLLSGRSDRHVGGITDGILDRLQEAGIKPLGTDGLREHQWDLLDYGEFIVHVFYHPVRTHFDLESMWSDAQSVPLDVPADTLDLSEMEGLLPPDPMPTFRGGAEFGGFGDEFEDDGSDQDFADDETAFDEQDADDLGVDDTDEDDDELDDQADGPLDDPEDDAPQPDPGPDPSPSAEGPALGAGRARSTAPEEPATQDDDPLFKRR